MTLSDRGVLENVRTSVDLRGRYIDEYQGASRPDLDVRQLVLSAVEPAPLPSPSFPGVPGRIGDDLTAVPQRLFCAVTGPDSPQAYGCPGSASALAGSVSGVVVRRRGG
jgi:hypothetical protein